jgi:hypothetical protein
MRIFAEENGDSALLDAGQVLLAPEVVHLEFRYYDGQQVTEVWDMQEMQSLPVAVEVRIWLAHQGSEPATGAPYDLASLVAAARQYRQTVHLPMSAVAASAMGGDAGGESSSSSSSGSSSFESSDASSSGSSFGSP